MKSYTTKYFTGPKGISVHVILKLYVPATGSKRDTCSILFKLSIPVVAGRSSVAGFGVGSSIQG